MGNVRSRHTPSPAERTEWPPIDRAALEAVRAMVKRHIETAGSLVGLDIAPGAPPHGMPFAFISAIPTLAKHLRHDRGAWHRCSYCETNNKFIDGRVVYCADGLLRLIGEDCWEHHISEADWKSASEEYADYRRKERFESLMHEYPPILDRLRVSIRAAHTDDRTFGFAEGFKVRLQRAMPELVDALEERLRRGGQLDVIRMVPDFSDLEGARGQRTAQEKEEKATRYKERPVTLYQLPSAVALTDEPKTARGLVERAMRRNWAATAHLRQTDWTNLGNRAFSQKANEFEKMCREMVAHLSDAGALIGAIAQFMGARNMAGIAKWANDTDCELCFTGRYTPIPGGMLFEPEAGDDTRITLPSGFGLQFDGLADLQRLLDRH